MVLLIILEITFDSIQFQYEKRKQLQARYIYCIQFEKGNNF